MSKLFASRQNHGYVVVDFDNVTERGLKSLIAALKRAGQPVNDIQADNKPKRKDAQVVKQAKFFFENGQTITLFIGSEGDIYQLQLNTTKQPLPDATSEQDLAKSMAAMMSRNQAKFDKQQARKTKQVAKDTSSTKPLTRSLSKRLSEVQATLSATQENHQSVSDALELAIKQSSDLDAQIADLESTLEAEKAETKDLEQKVEETK